MPTLLLLMMRMVLWLLLLCLLLCCPTAAAAAHMMLPLCAQAGHAAAVSRNQLLLPAEQVKVLHCATAAAHQQLRVCQRDRCDTTNLRRWEGGRFTASKVRSSSMGAAAVAAAVTVAVMVSS